MVSIYICQKFFGDVNYVSCFVVVFHTHGTRNILKTPNQKRTLPRKNTYSRWFKVTFSSPSWRSLNPLKGSRELTIPKRSRLESPGSLVVTVVVSSSHRGLSRSLKDTNAFWLKAMWMSGHLRFANEQVKRIKWSFRMWENIWPGKQVAVNFHQLHP